MTRRSPLLLAGLLSLLPGCGHKANPLPPLRRMPPAPASFRLAQRGEAIELSARAPAASVDGVAYESLALEFVYAAGEVDLERKGTHLLVRTSGGEQVEKTLALPAPGTLLRAAVRAIADGAKGPRSTTKALVVQAPLEAPLELVASVVEDGVALAWRGVRPKEVAPPPALPGFPGFRGSPGPQAPGAPGAATTPAGAASAAGTAVAPQAPPQAAAPQATNPEAGPTPAAGAGGEKAAPTAPTTAAAVTAGPAKGEGKSAEPAARRNGFHVYRRRADAVYGKPLGGEPLELRNFKDTSAPLGARVCYAVRGVASPDPLIESGPSNEVCVVMRDVTPPAAPAGIAIAARPGGLELIWSPSAEPDLAGYRVLRAGAGGAPEKLAELPATKTSYLDASAQPGVRYSYMLVAFDQAGNQSAPSEPVEAALP
jgi:hypothetical protein